MKILLVQAAGREGLSFFDPPVFRVQRKQDLLKTESCWRSVCLTVSVLQYLWLNVGPEGGAAVGVIFLGLFVFKNTHTHTHALCVSVLVISLWEGSQGPGTCVLTPPSPHTLHFQLFWGPGAASLWQPSDSGHQWYCSEPRYPPLRALHRLLLQRDLPAEDPAKAVVSGCHQTETLFWVSAVMEQWVWFSVCFFKDKQHHVQRGTETNWKQQWVWRPPHDLLPHPAHAASNETTTAAGCECKPLSSQTSMNFHNICFNA